MFFKKKSAIDWVIAGLGNPGKKYEHTRHNVGFEALDFAAETYSIPVRRAKFDALYGEGRVEGQRVMLTKPQTFMNLSGKSLCKVTEYYKLPPQRVIVLCDDVALDAGVLRIRESGSDGGHNGLKSIATFLGEEFYRIRIGVGKKPHPDYDMVDWVLAKMTGDDYKKITARYADIAAALALLMCGKTQEAMSRYNGEKK